VIGTRAIITALFGRNPPRRSGSRPSLPTFEIARHRPAAFVALLLRICSEAGLEAGHEFGHSNNATVWPTSGRDLIAAIFSTERGCWQACRLIAAVNTRCRPRRSPSTVGCRGSAAIWSVRPTYAAPDTLIRRRTPPTNSNYIRDTIRIDPNTIEAAVLSQVSSDEASFSSGSNCK